MKKSLLLSVLIVLAAETASFAQGQFTSAFSEADDSLSAMVQRRFNVKSDLSIWRAMKRGDVIDLYFTRNLSDFPWRSEDVRWFTGQIRQLWPRELREYKMGGLFCNNIELDELITPGIGDGKGKARDYRYAFRSHKASRPLVENLDARKPSHGLAGRNIAMWQSHGLFYDAGPGLWSWQRTPVFRTYEDLYTQSYVLPYLIPMLENAGAYVITPRERDTQLYEVVCDNDPHYTQGAAYPLSDWALNFEEPLAPRAHGAYSETGKWSSAGTGFADSKEIYVQGENPFTMGSARQTACTGGKGNARARWTPIFAERGRYAVYVSYKTVPGSTVSAHYTVHHLGGDTEFCVDQTKGGGTWIYLGTFDFDAGSEGYVTLDNGTPKGHAGGKVVTADAVRFGGGIGKVARGGTVSGMPSYTEGALYWMQWAGAPQSLWTQWDGDYTRDYAGRGAWVKWMKDELDVPVDMSLAFHSDAGVTPNDSIVGTLAIYTLLEKNSRKFVNGQDRMACRFLADCVQSQVTSDLGTDYDSLWRRRQLWDRSYSECRTTDVPGMILELLSHQNFADMCYGLDPKFRFDVSRAVYKGMLKFLSSYYGFTYTVQPLPVKDFSATFAQDGKVHLSWQGVKDPKEPTADPAGYTVYTRVDGLGWDSGKTVKGTSVDLPAPEGHIYSYKVVAYNDGGDSFPSEILSVGKPAGATRTVLVVNNFTRVSGPSYFSTPEYAGFDDRLDSGVPDGKEILFIGEDYEHRRMKEYASNNAPGFGGSDYGFAGRSYAGNTFDYPYVHGKALFELGYAFCSQSSAAFETAADAQDYFALDIICGKQVSTVIGTAEHGPRFRVFPEGIRKAIKGAADAGTHILVSGANIATDGWDSVYPVKDEDFNSYQVSVQSFANNVLGYKWISSRASRDGVILAQGSFIPVRSMEIYNEKNPISYCVENPDGIRPNDSKGRTVLKYRSSNVSAGVFYTGSGYRTACFGFPLETLKDESAMRKIMGSSLEFFAGND